jgi:hypothetical protein
LIEAKNGPLGALQLISIDRWGSSAAIWLDGRTTGLPPQFSGWDVLRRLRGEIAEVFAFAASEVLAAEEPIIQGGRYERGGLFQVTLLPERSGIHWRVAAVGSHGTAELLFPSGWPGPGKLHWIDRTGTEHVEQWNGWNPWPVLVEKFEARVAAWTTEPKGLHPRASRARGVPREEHPSWQDAIRSLELDDGARRSVERRRVNTLEYQEATEEVGFKGTMTLLGCGLLWAIMFLVILSAWIPQLGWLVIPFLVGFLALQLLRWVLPQNPQGQVPQQGKSR